jgi:hypothetical protein
MLAALDGFVEGADAGAAIARATTAGMMATMKT